MNKVQGDREIFGDGPEFFFSARRDGSVFLAHHHDVDRWEHLTAEDVDVLVDVIIRARIAALTD